MTSARPAVYILIAAIALFVWYAHDALLLVFAGVLLALVLRGCAELVARKTQIAVVRGVWLVAVAGFILIALVVALLGNAVAAQIAALRDSLPSALGDVIEGLRTSELGLWIANNLPNATAILPDAAHLLIRAGGVLSGALGALVGILTIFFVSIAAALEPQVYVNGLVQLFPANRREHVRGVVLEIGDTLRVWLTARLLTMAVTAMLVTLGLTVLHVPLALALGVLAGLLAFIPNVGAFIAAVPSVLLAFVQSPASALAVVVMYVIVHVLDDWVVAPVVERQVVKLPPILTLVAQIVLAAGAGAIGVMLAAPLVAMTIVIVHRLWVEDVADPALADLAVK